MGNAARKLVNDKKAKKQNLKVVKSKAKRSVEEVCMSLEDILKIYPGLSFEKAALLSTAHNIFKKRAA